MQKTCFSTYARMHHDGLAFKDAGIRGLNDKPYLGASADGQVECNCHEKVALEIKCSYKYQNGLDRWFSDTSFPVSPNGVMRR